MSNETKFIEGLSFKAPNERAPEYVKAKGWIQRDKLIAWLQSQPESINFDLKVSQAGKWYPAVDDWKPEGQRQDKPAPRKAPAPPADDFDSDPIPF
jgi:hypothetical protein